MSSSTTKTSNSIPALPPALAISSRQHSDMSAFPWPEWSDSDSSTGGGGAVPPSGTVSSPQGASKTSMSVAPSNAQAAATDDTESTLTYLPPSLRSQLETLKRAPEVSPPPYWRANCKGSSVDLSMLTITVPPQAPYPPWTVQPSSTLPSAATPYQSTDSRIHTPLKVANAFNFTSYEDVFVPKEKIPGSPKAPNELISPMLQVNATLTQKSPVMLDLVVKLHALVLFYHRSPFFTANSSFPPPKQISPVPATNSPNAPVEMEQMLPWDHIYPKSKDGLPMINAAGKYAVKLWAFGAWRKVVVDDKIPLDKQGEPLLPTSPIPGEVWPWIISKAVLKLCAISYDHPDKDSTGICIFKMMTGCESQNLLNVDYSGLRLASRSCKTVSDYAAATIHNLYAAVSETSNFSSASAPINNKVGSPSRNVTSGTPGPNGGTSSNSLPSSARIKSAAISPLPCQILPGFVFAVLTRDWNKNTFSGIVLAQILQRGEANQEKSPSFRVRLFPCYIPMEATNNWESEVVLSADDLVASSSSITAVHIPSHYRIVTHIAHAVHAGPTNSIGGMGAISPSTPALAAVPSSSVLATSSATGNQESWPQIHPIIYNPNERPIDVLIGFQCHYRLGNITCKRKPSLLIEESIWDRAWGEATPYLISSRFNEVATPSHQPNLARLVQWRIMLPFLGKNPCE